MKRNLYLKTVSVEEAREKFREALIASGAVKTGAEFAYDASDRETGRGSGSDVSVRRPEAKAASDVFCAELSSPEEISVYTALNRITAEPVFARYCSPLFNCAAMDGIALDSRITADASESRPLRLKAGDDFISVDTGDPIRSPFDAVIMAEDVTVIDDETVEIRESVPGWNCVRPVGEDIAAGEMIIPSNHVIRPMDVGAMLASGTVRVKVKAHAGAKTAGGPCARVSAGPGAECAETAGLKGREKLSRPHLGAAYKVGIIPTGDEIIPPDRIPGEGDIIDSNSGLFSAQVEDRGGIPVRYPIVPDDYGKIKAALLKALEENDMVLINAGSSAGREDFTVHVLRELGEVIVHGVAMKPGKPVILAIAGGKPVIGLPGYPVSAYLAFENFAGPIIDYETGAAAELYGEKSENTVEAVLSKRIVSSLKHREYVRVKAGAVNGRIIASPLARGAAAQMSLVRADGFLVIPQNVEGYEAGDRVELRLYRDEARLEDTLVVIGSHDMLLDTLNDMMNVRWPGMSVSSSHVGSLGGLMALKRGETVIAPTHLLDGETGEYNLSYLRRIFAPGEVCLIKGVERIQGIMVKKGNPLGINGIKDLPRGRFVNRQRGSGTRVLLDYLLKREETDPAAISGYEKEAATHMAVAASVAGAETDCGMGIQPAAEAMGLDFIRVGVEEYDFALMKKDLDLPAVKAFLELLTGEEFRKKMEAIGGYGFSDTGKIIELN